MARNRKKNAVLFEAMSKVPQSQSEVRRGGLSWLRRSADENTAPILVAEALTEEDAALELAEEQSQRDAERAERERIEHERESCAEAKRAERERKRTERRARKASRRAERRRQAEAGPDAALPPVRIGRGGRIILSLGTVSCVSVVAVIASMVLAGYAVGRRSGRQPDQLETIAGIAADSDKTQSPLLPPIDRPAEGSAHRVEVMDDPDLSELLKPPPARQPRGVTPNKPARVASDDPRAADAEPSLNYLQIESFLVNRFNSIEQVRSQLSNAQAFLAERGIPTVARTRSSGFVLFSQQGFQPGSKFERQRTQLQQRIEALGREYRRTGGRYEFRGCYFVNYAKAHRGALVTTP
ncbi:MAG: hypothetical protein ACE5F9_10380 [Phycisphaerae bacterium]